MKYTILAASLALSGCISDQRLADLQEGHRAWVCSHQVTVSLAANFAIENAFKIKDLNARSAVIMSAENDLAILATCPV